MGGSDSIRGYLVQAMVLILDTFQNDVPWFEVSLEPKHESEKVDIKWGFVDFTRVVQVKSSINVFEKSSVQNWCTELKTSTLADEYQLILVGNTSKPVIELTKSGFNGVKISSQSLDLDGMIKQIAHGLDVFCEKQGIPSRTPFAREMLAKALVTEFEKYSIEGNPVKRSEFEQLLSKWIFLLLPRIDILEDHGMVSLVRPNYQYESWFQPLLLRKDGNTNSLQSILLSEGRDKIALIGKSGGGKTSLMKMAVYEINLHTPYIAFWIPLLHYTVDLFTTIKRFLGWFDLPTEKVVSTLQKHHIILFFDGFNETPRETRDFCMSEIVQLMSVYQGKLCVSFLDSERNLYDFGVEVFEVTLLDEVAINNAIGIYFEGNEGKIRFLLELIKKPGVLAFIQTPIHLGFFLELAESNYFEGKTYSDLFGSVIEKRLARNSQHGKQGRVHINQKIDLLMSLAYRSFIEDRGLKMSTAFVRDTLSNQSQADIDLALDELIKSDILLSIGNSEIMWFHQSFSDYFAGRYLAGLAEIDKSLMGFPFHESRAVSAIAHAVRLSTQSSDLMRRSKVYLSFLESNPTFDLIRTVSMEYGWSNMVGDSKTIEEAEDGFNQYKWGNRFLHAYELILNVMIQENPYVVKEMPSPKGLTVFFNTHVDFCLMLFSENNEVRFERLETLENLVFQIIKEKRTCSGFCLYAPFLYLLDPEILAYLVIEILIKLSKTDFNQKKTYKGYPELPITPMEYISWGNMIEPPGNFDSGGRPPTRVLLNWNDFYNPVTFQINPDQTKSRRPRPRSYSVSLGLLLPFNSRNWHKVDLPNKIYIPFPIHLLNGYYFPNTISGEQSQGRLANQLTQFVHLEKI